MKLRERIGPKTVYTLILLIGICLLFVVWIITQKFPSTEFLLNLSTEIIGVAIIFFILRYYVESREENLLKRVIKLRQNLSFNNLENTDNNQNIFEQFSLLESEILGLVIKPDNHATREKDKSLTIFDFEEYLSSAESLYMVGENMYGILGLIETRLPELIQKGLKVKILTFSNDGNNPITRLVADSQTQFARGDKDILLGTKDAFQFLKNIKKELEVSYPNHRGELVHKILKWIPPCSIMIIKGKEGSFGKAKIVYYRPSKYKIDRIPRYRLRVIIDKLFNSKLFEFYEEQFNILWEYHTEEKPVKMTTRLSNN